VRFFVSYARRDKARVQSLAGVIQRLGHEPWVDTNLSGGQAWWDEILRRIREADVFMFAVSEASLESEACGQERSYAQGLGKPVLPVMVARVRPQLLPRDLAALQFVDYSVPGEDAALQFAGAVMNVRAARALPDPLPPPPPIPVSYLSGLGQRVVAPSLSLEDQRGVVAELGGALRRSRGHEEHDDHAAALDLLHRLNERPDLYAETARRIDELIAADGANTAPPPGPATPPARGLEPVVPQTWAAQPEVPQSEPRKTPRWVIALAVVGAIFLLLVVISMLSPSCFYDAFGNYVCP
jgi:hypothetical protein